MAAGTSLAAQSRLWQPDERVLITSFADVGALAADQRKLYIASPGGLAIYDYVRERWDYPSTVEDEYPAGEQPSALAYDPIQMEVWLGTANGGLHRWRAVPSRWETVAFALGQIQAIVPSIGIEVEGIWVQTANGWYRAGRLAFGACSMPRDRVPATIAQRAVSRRSFDPSLNAFRATLGLDPLGRRWPITSFTTGDRPEQYWFGSGGNLVFKFDARGGSPTWFWYGATTRGVSAIARLADTLWFGGDGRGPRSGLVRATRDLQRWYLLDPRDGAPNTRVDQIEVTPTHTYTAGNDGVSVLDRRNGRWQRLSSEAAVSVATHASALFIGTRTGLRHINRAASRVISGPAIQRVRVIADTLWIATANGVFNADAALHPDSLRLVQLPLPTARFADVARAGSRMFALADDALFVRDSNGWSGPLRVPALGGLRRLNTIAADGDAVWIGGAMGIARYQPAPEQWLFFLAPGDLPAGAVQHIVPDGEYVWAATPAGALRLQWRR
ncbi:MAG: hypothetical protein WEE89_05375 [Gemmatimonadota bacterium]